MNIWYGEGGCEGGCEDGGEGEGEGSSECCAENFRIRKYSMLYDITIDMVSRYSLFIAKTR